MTSAESGLMDYAVERYGYLLKDETSLRCEVRAAEFARVIRKHHTDDLAAQVALVLEKFPELTLEL